MKKAFPASAVAVLAVMGVSVAMAEPADFHEDVWGDMTARLIDVYTGDLKLSDPRDRGVAFVRIERAARFVCKPDPDLRVLDEVRDYRDCRFEAFDEAMAVLEGRTAREQRRGHVYTHEYP